MKIYYLPADDARLDYQAVNHREYRFLKYESDCEAVQPRNSSRLNALRDAVREQLETLAGDPISVALVYDLFTGRITAAELAKSTGVSRATGYRIAARLKSDLRDSLSKHPVISAWLSKAK